MKQELLPDAESAARRAAHWLAAEARAAIALRERFAFAVSGGTTPWKMLAALSEAELPWDRIHVFQVDERVAPEGHPDRNWTHLRESLLDRAPIPAANAHPMAVCDPDLEAAAQRYGEALRGVAGTPPMLDCVHLGLGPDGHTASLVPGDAVLDVSDRDVAPSAAPYQGHRRMTLTFPTLSRARRVLWLVTGAAKVEMLARLRAGDRSIPAGRVASEHALVLADRAADGAGAAEKAGAAS